MTRYSQNNMIQGWKIGAMLCFNNEYKIYVNEHWQQNQACRQDYIGLKVFFYCIEYNEIQFYIKIVHFSTIVCNTIS